MQFYLELGPYKFLFASWTMDLQANPASDSARFPENLCAEDRFKLAVSEMVQLINI